MSIKELLHEAVDNQARALKTFVNRKSDQYIQIEYIDTVFSRHRFAVAVWIGDEDIILYSEDDVSGKDVEIILKSFFYSGDFKEVRGNE